MGCRLSLDSRRKCPSFPLITCQNVQITLTNCFQFQLGLKRTRRKEHAIIYSILKKIAEKVRQRAETTCSHFIQLLLMVNLLLVKFALLRFFNKDFILKSVYIYLALKYYWRHYAYISYWRQPFYMVIWARRRSSHFAGQIRQYLHFSVIYDHEYWCDSKNQSHYHLLYSLGLYWLPCYPHTELVAL